MQIMKWNAEQEHAIVDAVTELLRGSRCLEGENPTESKLLIAMETAEYGCIRLILFGLAGLDPWVIQCDTMRNAKHCAWIF